MVTRLKVHSQYWLWMGLPWLVMDRKKLCFKLAQRSPRAVGFVLDLKANELVAANELHFVNWSTIRFCCGSHEVIGNFLRCLRVQRSIPFDE